MNGSIEYSNGGVMLLRVRGTSGRVDIKIVGRGYYRFVSPQVK